MNFQPYLSPILTGFFTGLGVALANWLHSRHIEKKLDKLLTMVKRK